MKIKLSNLIMNYEIQGDKEPLILLHGNNESHTIFNKSINILSKYYKVYAIDSRMQGKSYYQGDSIHYEDMAKDLYEFIEKLNIKKPIICGYSDGAIIAMLLVIFNPHIASELILCGANINPEGIDNKAINLSKAELKTCKDKKDRLLIEMMLNEPNISCSQLNSIDCNTLLLVGEYDCIKLEHTILIHQNIKGSTLKILENEDHGSYVYNCDILANEILKFNKLV